MSMTFWKVVFTDESDGFETVIPVATNGVELEAIEKAMALLRSDRQDYVKVSTLVLCADSLDDLFCILEMSVWAYTDFISMDGQKSNATTLHLDTLKAIVKTASEMEL